MFIAVSDFLIDPYRSTVCLASVIACISFGWRVRGWLGLAWTAVALSGIRVAMGTQTFYRDDLVLIDRVVFESLTWLLLSTIVFLQFKVNHLIHICRVVGILNCAMLLIDPRYGVLSNSSMSGTFQALLIPLYFAGNSKFFLGLGVASVLAVLLTKASNPILIMGVEFAAMALYLPWKGRLTFLLGSLGLGSLGVWLMGGFGRFTDSSGRWGLYNDAWDFWRQLGEPWLFGTGTGSFLALSRNFIQDGKNLWPFMHSDWQQILFEQGFLGLFSALGLFMTLLWRSREKPLIFSFWIGLGAAGVFNMPLRYVPTLLLALAMLKYSYAERTSASTHR